MTYIIKHSDILGMCEAVPFFLKQYAELIENGHAHPYCTWSNSNRCVYATIDNKVVGCIVYDYSKITRMIWIILSAVDDKFRKIGIYTQMHAELERQAKKLDAKKIASHVHVDNTVRQASCKKIGLKPEFIRMVKHLTPDGKPFRAGNPTPMSDLDDFKYSL